MKKILIIACFIVMGTAFAGCNTVEGVGRDIEQAGESIQNL